AIAVAVAPPDPPPRRSTAHIRVESLPARAAVFVDGVERGPTPAELDVPAGAGALKVVVRARGYRAAARSVVPDKDQVVKVQLVAAPAGSSRSATAAPPGSDSAATPPTLW